MTRSPLLKMSPTTPDVAQGEAATLLSDAEAKLGFVPNMYTYMANLPGVLAGYLSTYEAFRETTGFTPAEQETVFLTISRVNGCTYCLAAHSMLADKKSGVPADCLAALREGKPLPDEKLNAVATFTEAMVISRGSPGKEAVDAFPRRGIRRTAGAGSRACDCLQDLLQLRQSSGRDPRWMMSSPRTASNEKARTPAP